MADEQDRRKRAMTDEDVRALVDTPGQTGHHQK